MKILIEESVLRQALEALETHVPHYVKDRGYEPITNLRTAIEQVSKVEPDYRAIRDGFHTAPAVPEDEIEELREQLAVHYAIWHKHHTSGSVKE